MRFEMSCFLCPLLALVATGVGEDLSALCADRAAVEHVYYNHWLGEKPAFEQAVPKALIERLVAEDLHKEAVLEHVYGTRITPAMIQAEVQRINTTTHSPDVLGELKAALGSDADRFARAVAKPILVERLLRDKFDNDDALHAASRREAQSVRERLLTAKKTGAPLPDLFSLLKQNHANEVSEATWKLDPPPPQTNAPNAQEIEIKERFGPNAQILFPTADSEQHAFYYDDLPAPLRKVLSAQLRQAGDVSAVIEISSGFLLYLVKEKSADALSVAVLTVRKRSYEEWLQRTD